MENRYVKISLIVFADDPQEISIFEHKLVPLAQSIVRHWEPIKSWSHVSLIISQNGIILAGATMLSIVAVSIYGIIQEELAKKANLEIYNRLSSDEDKALLKAIHQAEKELSTGNRIAAIYEEFLNRKIGLKTFLRKLSEAEEAGLVKKAIKSREDIPIIIWRINISL